MSPTVHASAVLVGARAVLIRGASGAGKSRLALELIEACARDRRFGRLVGDDRVHLEKAGGRLIVRPAAALAGLIELRGSGILRRDYEPAAVVGLVVDLGVPDAERLPEQTTTEVLGIELPQMAFPTGESAVLPVLNRLCALVPSP